MEKRSSFEREEVVAMKTIMDVEIGSPDDNENKKYCYDVWNKDRELWLKATELLNYLALGGCWKGYYAALAALLKALDGAKKGE